MKAGDEDLRAPMTRESGVTLLEMLVVVVLIAILGAITFPAATSGLDSIRMASTADGLATFLSNALNRAERKQQMLELTISRTENSVVLRAVPDFEKRYDLPRGIRIVAVMPEVPGDPELPRRFVLYPGGAPPRVGVRIRNQKGAQRTISLDPVTGVPMVERTDNAR